MGFTLVCLAMIMVHTVLQLGSLVGLTLIGPLVGAWRGRSFAAAGGCDDHSHLFWHVITECVLDGLGGVGDVS